MFRGDWIGIILLLLLLAAAGVLAGFIGSITGLGGGVVVVPFLSLYLGVPIAYATGTSLISTIATSTGSARSYIKERIANMHIGVSLEIGTTLGAITGSLIAAEVYALHLQYIIYILFGLTLFGSSYFSIRKLKMKHFVPGKSDWSTKFFRLNGSFIDEATMKKVNYHGRRWLLGLAIMFIAGMLSGLLGIGSGVLKVLAMDSAMTLPLKVTTTTSDFMIGVTAATSAGVYWERGFLQPILIAPVVLGVLAGARIGSKYLVKLNTRIIRYIFIFILIILGAQMLLRGLGVF